MRDDEKDTGRTAPYLAVTGGGIDWQGHSTLSGWIDLLAKCREQGDILAPYIDEDGAEEIGPAVRAAIERGARFRFVVRNGRSSTDQNVRGLQVLSREITLRLAEVGVALYQVADTETEGGLPPGMHAKVVAIDAKFAYVGSANMTRNGLHRNLEIGVMVGQPTARELHELISRLIRAKTARPLSWQSIARGRVQDSLA